MVSASPLLSVPKGSTPQRSTRVPLALTTAHIQRLLNVSGATAHRLKKQLPRLPLSGMWRCATTDFERIFGRKLTEDDFASEPTPTAAPAFVDTAEIESGIHHEPRTRSD